MKSAKNKMKLTFYQKTNAISKYRRKDFIRFYSQVIGLIVRRVRDLGVYSEIITLKQINKIKYFNQIKGIILSGGPST